jgi:hypothetical protein
LGLEKDVRSESAKDFPTARDFLETHRKFEDKGGKALKALQP